MKRVLVLLLAVCMALPCPALAGSDGAKAVAFSDPVLEAKVREAMGIPEGEITRAMAESVTELNLSQPEGDVPEEQKIHDLSALASFVNLTSLDLSGNACYDPGPLAGLSRLTALTLYNVPVSDAAPLSNLSQLRELRITGGLVDPGFLPGLASLEILEISVKTDTFPMAGLKGLKALMLAGGSLRDISGIADCKALEVLDLSWNLVEDIYALEGLPLRELYLEGNLITDYSPIRAVYPALEKKDFEAVFPEDLWGERPKDALVFNDPAMEKKVRAAMGIPEGYILRTQAEAVTVLDLSNPWGEETAEGDRIKDITVLKYFPNLTELNLSRNDIHNSLALSLLTKLNALYLEGNPMWDFFALGSLRGLTALALDVNGKDMSFLGSLTELTILSIGGGNKAIPAEVAGLKKLTSLFMGGGEVSDISILRELPNLTQVGFPWNLVEDLSPLEGLPLTKLYLNGNPISDFSPIKDVYHKLIDRDFTAFFPEGISEEPLAFSDTHFETALRAAMNIQNRPITQRDAYMVTKLDIYSDKEPGAQFADIAPLKYFVNLQELSFNGNNISDLTPLAGLLELTTLDVSYQKITDIGPLSGLIRLKSLCVRGNQIEDLTPLASLASLENLEAAQNRISDVTPLANLVNLRRLLLAENPISDWTPLAGLMPKLEHTDIFVVPADVPDEKLVFDDPNFEKALREAMGIQDRPITLRDAYIIDRLDLWTGENQANQFSGIGPLAHFPNLAQLEIHEANVSDLNALSGLTKLVSLGVYNGQVSDLTPLAGMTWLAELGLPGNRISDLTPLSGLADLKSLDVSRNQVTDVAPLAQLRQLVVLKLGGNPIVDFSPLKDIAPNLTEKDFEVVTAEGVSDEPLDIADEALGKKLAEVMGIAGRPITQRDAYFVTELNIRDSGIRDIGALQYFVNLTSLDASWNQIEDLTPLSGLTKLKGLNLRGNRLTDLVPITGLAGLDYLDAADNRIEDVTPLKTLTDLRQLYLENNPALDMAPLAAIEPNLMSKDFIAAVPDSVPDEPIAFADKNFEKAVRKLMDKPEGAVTQRDAYRVIRLDFTGAKIKSGFKDISPLAYFVNLNYLSMSGNGIADLAPLSSLASLRTLILDSQKIGDLVPLADLTGLRKLSLNNNRIADLTPLQGMTDLYALELSKNKIKDLTPLASLEGLQELTLQGNQLADIAALSKLTRLWKLDLRKNKIADVSALSGLTSLKELYLGGNKIKDFGPVKGIYPQLEQKDFKIK